MSANLSNLQTSSGRMHVVKAYVMPHHTVTLYNCNTKTLHHYITWSAQDFWRQKAKASSREVQMIADTMA